ncbi:MAG TPA: GTP 3',8-cyclase MoaA [Desulfobacteraceae bacterium]|nr:GTP 3',8-cyclase MoaA [Desulfobacteraceae bacterium]
MKKNSTKLIDKYNRRLNYLRISITDRCNLRCLYCMPREGIAKLRHEDILTYEEILRLSRIAVNLGIEKIRLTGGEPLLRSSIYDLLPRLTSIPGLKEVCLTTNGVYLKGNLEKIKSSGIKRINVSMDTLRRGRYEKITGSDSFQDVWEGIELARELGFDPIKINVVVLKGLNDDEVVDLAELSQKYPYHIRFIEYMPIGTASQDIPGHHVPNSWIKEQLKSLGKLVQVPRSVNDGPAERFRFEGAPGEVGFISPLTHHFCPTCNRLRLTASGRLRPCLLSDQEEDIIGPIRSGASDRDLEQIFLKTAFNKPYAHHLTSEDLSPFPAHMSSIGG